MHSETSRSIRSSAMCYLHCYIMLANVGTGPVSVVPPQVFLCLEQKDRRCCTLHKFTSLRKSRVGHSVVQSMGPLCANENAPISWSQPRLLIGPSYLFTSPPSNPLTSQRAHILDIQRVPCNSYLYITLRNLDISSHVGQGSEGPFWQGCQGHHGRQEGRQEEARLPFSSRWAAVPRGTYSQAAQGERSAETPAEVLRNPGCHPKVQAPYCAMGDSLSMSNGGAFL